MSVVSGVNFVLACMTPFAVCGAWELIHRAWLRTHRHAVSH